MKFTFKKNSKGISIIEAVIALGIVSLVITSFYFVLTQGVSNIILSRDRVQATAIANQEMEKMRNLPYDDIALVGGIPSGLLQPEENFNFGNNDFTVEREVFFRDDPGDNLYPTDTVSNDYKVVKVTVKWQDESEIKKTYFISRFVPPGLETDIGGGFLSINVIDYTGSPVPNVNVKLINNDVSPVINLDTQTQSNGNLLIQGAPAGNKSYQIELTKSNYETVVTYPPFPLTAFYPIDEHGTVVEDALNEKTLVMSKTSDATITTLDVFGNILSEINYDLAGGRRLNTDDPAVFNFSEAVESDAEGKARIENVSGGVYSLALDSSEDASYKLWKMDVGGDNSNQFDLTPGADLNVDMILADVSLDSLIIYIKDATTSAPIANASVRLKNDVLSYDATLTTDKYGGVYFPENETDILINGATYDVEVTASGYTSGSGNVTVNGLGEEIFTLEAE